jgi:hypothetical protein
MTEADLIAGFIACMLSFIAGLAAWRDLVPVKRRGNYAPIEHAPNVITFIRGKFVK